MMGKIKIGLIGTGKIGSAVMNGYSSEGGWQPEHIFVSPRNNEKATTLQGKYPTRITIAKNNQQVIDSSDIIFIGLLPNIARNELPKLSFPSDKKVVSMMATIPYDELLKLVGLSTESVIRTVPLPSSSKRTGPIISYPKNAYFKELLDHIGTPVMVETEAEITKMTGMTAMISFFYATCGTMHKWCVENGVESKTSRDFVSSFFRSLAQAGADSTEAFNDMAEEAATPGGLNEQTHRGLTETGAYELISDQLDSIYTRLTGEKPVERPKKRLKN